MAKIKFDNYDFEFNPSMDFETFTEQNIWYYSEKYLENNPTMAYAINDWDLECVYDSIDYEEVAELMTELYREFLIDNYWY